MSNTARTLIRPVANNLRIEERELEAGGPSGNDGTLKKLDIYTASVAG